MQEFVTIKKIIRIFTIGLLALWLAQCLFGAQHNARMISDTRQIMQLQELYRQGYEIRQMLQLFYFQAQRLPDPNEYSTLKCAHPLARCPFRERQGEFFVREGPYWLAIRPREKEKGLEFTCRVKGKPQSSTPWRPSMSCEQVSGNLPFHWPPPDAPAAADQ